MATQKTFKKGNAPKEKKEIKWIQNIRATLQNDTVQFVTGLLCVMVGAYMTLAFSSFILNGGADQSVMEQTNNTVLADNATKEQVQNATGEKGAHIAHLLINHSFGVSAYSIAIFLLVIGLNLMHIRKFDLKHWGICCATILIWGSLFLSVTVDQWFETSAIYWGGYHGHNVATWLDSQFGMPGIMLLLFVTAILFCIYLSSNTIDFIRNLFHPKSLLPGEDEVEDHTSALVFCFPIFPPEGSLSLMARSVGCVFNKSFIYPKEEKCSKKSLSHCSFLPPLSSVPQDSSTTGTFQNILMFQVTPLKGRSWQNISLNLQFSIPLAYPVMMRGFPTSEKR